MCNILISIFPKQNSRKKYPTTSAQTRHKKYKLPLVCPLSDKNQIRPKFAYQISEKKKYSTYVTKSQKKEAEKSLNKRRKENQLKIINSNPPT